MKRFPCAKINIGLHVVERRPDGYHNLETIFYPIPLCDELEVRKAEKDSLKVTGLPVEGDWQDNLVYRVVTMLREEGHEIPPLRIRLKKNIPTGAGLGGGSSDAAEMMKMMNKMFQLGLTDEQMEERVGRLGADCPFFIRCKPAYATGTGNVFEPVDLDLKGMTLILVKPNDFVSTKEAYANIQPRPSQTDLRTLSASKIDTWAGIVRNDFEDSVFPAHPAVAAVKQKLSEAGARYASMSGSGSAVYGIFEKEELEFDQVEPGDKLENIYGYHMTVKYGDEGPKLEFVNMTLTAVRLAKAILNDFRGYFIDSIPL